MSNVFRNELSPLIKKNLKPNELNKLLRYIGKYIDKNNSVLFDVAPNYRLYFTDTDKNIIYETTNITEKFVKEVINRSDDVNTSWKITTNPFIILTSMVIRDLSLTNKKKELHTVLLYLTLLFYSSTHSKYFRFEPNEQIMSYTINNLSNKYIIKQLGTMYKALEHTALVSHDTYKKLLDKGSDQDIIDYINALSTRVDGMIKNISREFYDNHENKRYMNLDGDSFDEDNFYMADNNSFATDRATNAIFLKFITHGVNYKLIDISANANNVSVSELRNTVTKFSQDTKESDNIKKLIAVILELFIVEGRNKPSDIRSKKFLYESLMIYKKSNTNDKAIIEVRNILDTWLKEGSATYKKTNREATQNNFKRALYMFFILTIQDNA